MISHAEEPLVYNYVGPYDNLVILAPVAVAELAQRFLPLTREYGKTETAEAKSRIIVSSGPAFILSVAGVMQEFCRAETEMEAAHYLCDAIMRAATAQVSSMMAVHAAGLLTSSGLVLLVGDSHAGKSSVAGIYTAMGGRIVCDDRAAVNLEAGTPQRVRVHALGLQPKARLPVPSDMPSCYAEFVKANTCLRLENIAYLGVGDTQLAGPGESFALKHLLFLNRQEETIEGVQITALARSEALRQLVRHSYAPHITALAHLDLCTAILDALSESSQIRQLRFSQSGSVAAHFLNSGTS